MIEDFVRIHTIRFQTARRPSPGWLAPLVLVGVTLLVSGAVLVTLACSAVLFAARGLSRLIGRPFEKILDSAARGNGAPAGRETAHGRPASFSDPAGGVAPRRAASPAPRTIDLAPDAAGVWREDE
ncbi:MAG TPA: hypothetical protein PLG73_13585 [Candidatus Sumerlaeota bacterium]|nr:hypothetical protein [Candidatus Sumerlaeota bacterium]